MQISQKIDFARSSVVRFFSLLVFAIACMVVRQYFIAFRHRLINHRVAIARLIQASSALSVLANRQNAAFLASGTASHALSGAPFDGDGVQVRSLRESGPGAPHLDQCERANACLRCIDVDCALAAGPAQRVQRDGDRGADQGRAQRRRRQHARCGAHWDGCAAPVSDAATQTCGMQAPSRSLPAPISAG